MFETRTDPTSRQAITARLQSTLRANPALKLEFLATISRLFREHEVALEPEVLKHLTLSMEGAPISQHDEPPDEEPPPST